MPVRIVLFIDSLNSGGAQRQICTLAILLKKRGYDVTVVVYHDIRFFNHLLENEDIKIVMVNAESKFNRVSKYKKIIDDISPNIVIAFLRSPSIIAELAKLFDRRYGLIVSERSAGFEGSPTLGISRYLLHSISDFVVTNSHLQRQFIHNKAPWLRHKLKTIINCVDMKTFHCKSTDYKSDISSIKFAVVGRYEEEKQPKSIVKVLEMLIKNDNLPFIQVQWYGNDFFVNGLPTKKSLCYISLKAEIKEKYLEGRFKLHKPVQEISEVYHDCNALLLPSLYEGCSNVICEAMACGKPILASRVGDNSLLIENGLNGFLFDPKSIEDMAEKIVKFISLSPEEKIRMGEASRERAINMFSPDRFSYEYEQLVQILMDRQKRKNIRSRYEVA